MDRLHIDPARLNAIRARAVEDAQTAQRSVSERALRKGEEAPPHVLVELIGKGSYGRVYKGEDTRTREVVAVKIIDIDGSDTANPRYADTYSEFLKEIGALNVLSEGKARNINHIIDALPVGQTMWMVTEYCGGGSVATLMRPKPGGLQEKYIIPILREVAEALGWVHRAGIIHRDVKCANILLTTTGSIQLCDFGVAGTLSAGIDKRSTFLGTPHWMAPELFASFSTSESSDRGTDSALSYGAEVDIWAFGAVVYELATGLPPNAAKGVKPRQLNGVFESSIPRLEGERYSDNLKSLANYCLEPNPRKRPTIEQVQGHAYIHSTQSTHPTTILVELITRFRAWEDEGGVRGSLFNPYGAAGPSHEENGEGQEWEEGEWDFDSTLRVSTVQDTHPPSPPTHTPRRRRAPPTVMAALPIPLEKVFYAETLTTYDVGSRAHYFPSAQDSMGFLPLRRHGDGDETLKPPLEDGKRRTQEWTFASSLPAPLDTVEGDAHRRTQDWTFASSVPAVLDPEDVEEGYASTLTPSRRAAADIDGHLASMGDGLIDFDMGLPPSPSPPPPVVARTTATIVMMGSRQDNILSRVSVAESLIDLDMSFPPSPAPPLASTPAQARRRDADADAQPASPSALPPQISQDHLPMSREVKALPPPPSAEALSTTAGVDVVRREMGRLLGGLVEELVGVRDVLSGPTS